MIKFDHFPVMFDEAMDLLDVKPGGVYVDGTLGGGGHSEGMLNKLTSGKLIGIDQDYDAIKASKNRLDKYKNFFAQKNSFHNLPSLLRELDIKKIDGILLDLGVSSFQLDTPERGFSYRFDGPLDMRMDADLQLTAGDIVNNYSEKQLTKILFEYGEENQARKFARLICTERERTRIETTVQLAELIKKVSRKKKGETVHPAMRTFMALRIAVNNELSPLAEAIKNIVPLINPGGRIVVITFHSLEDRIVKNTFRLLENPCSCPRDIPYCVCKQKPLLKNLTKKPITPSKTELENNSRSHSAKLRAAERVGGGSCLKNAHHKNNKTYYKNAGH